CSCSAWQREKRGICPTQAVSASGLKPFPQRRLDGIDNGVEAGAAAVVTGQEGTDLCAVHQLGLRQQLRARHEHAGRAETALQRVAVYERLLEVCNLAGVGQSLNGDNLRAVRLHRQHQAAAHDLAVQAPQTPCSQPRGEPVSPRSMRTKSTKCWRTGTMRVTCSPLTVSVIWSVSSLMPSSLDPRPGPARAV